MIWMYNLKIIEINFVHISGKIVLKTTSHIPPGAPLGNMALIKNIV